MELSEIQKSEKKRRFSLWQHLRGKKKKFSEKSKENTKIGQDITLVSANKIYGSFRQNTPQCTIKSGSPDLTTLPENCVTFEESDLQNFHRDAGILFLNSKNQYMLKTDVDTSKHVQFAPTPYNKYHTYTSDPRKGLKIPNLGKENFEIRNKRTPLPSVLRNVENIRKENENILSSQSDLHTIDENSETFVKPNLPRTSTRCGGLKQNTPTLPYLDESSIHQRSQNSSIAGSLKKPILSVGGSMRICSQPSQSIPVDFQRPFVEQKHIKNSFFTSDRLSRNPVDYPVAKQVISVMDPSKSRTNPKIQSINDSKRSCPLSDYNLCDDKPHSLVQTKEIIPYFKVYNPRLPQTQIPSNQLSSNRHSFHQDFLQKKSGENIQNTLYQQKVDDSKTKSSRTFEKPLETKSNDNLLNQSSCFQIPPFVSTRVDFQRFTGEDEQLFNLRQSIGLKELQNMKESGSFPYKIKTNGHLLRNRPSRSSRRNVFPSIQDENLERKQKSKYDGFSSMADDECSMNCSCEECMTDFKNMPKNLRKSWRKEHPLKDKLFFPDQMVKQRISTRHHPFPQPPVVCKRSEDNIYGEAWYRCNDIMCKSPEVNPSLSIKSESLYENVGVAIDSDYDVTEIADLEKKSSIPVENKKTAEAHENEALLFKNSLPNILSSSNNEMSPRTKQISQTCITALQETLKNILQEYRNQPQPSFSISSFNSENESSEKQKTIVIKIQRDGDHSVLQEEKMSQFNKNHWSESSLRKINDGFNGQSFVSKSLPDLSRSICNVKELGPEITFTSSVNLSPTVKGKTKNPLADKESFVEKTLEATIESIGDKDDNEELPFDWNRSESAEETRSGSSSLLNTSKTPPSNDYTGKEQEIIQEFIKLGMNGSKILPSTPKILKTKKFKAKEVLSGKAKLKLSLYNTAGIVTIHVMKAVKLSSARSMELNAYVKVSLYPDDTRRVQWRSKVVKGQKNPVFNQKFSFEIFPDDSKKRLIFSIWHRDLEKKRSEFLGCMSFGVHRVLDSTQQLSGWYRVLKEVVGTKKHFFARHGNGNAFTRFLTDKLKNEN